MTTNNTTLPPSPPVPTPSELVSHAVFDGDDCDTQIVTSDILRNSVAVARDGRVCWFLTRTFLASVADSGAVVAYYGTTTAAFTLPPEVRTGHRLPSVERCSPTMHADVLAAMKRGFSVR